MDYDEYLWGEEGGEEADRGRTIIVRGRTDDGRFDWL
jgi:hypothetical protein